MTRLTICHAENMCRANQLVEFPQPGLSGWGVDFADFADFLTE